MAASTKKAASTRARISFLLKDNTRESLYELARAIAEKQGLTGYSTLDKRGLARFVAKAEAGTLKGKAKKPTMAEKRAKAQQKKKSSQVRYGADAYFAYYILGNGKPEEINGYMGPYTSGRAAKIDAKSLARSLNGGLVSVSEKDGNTWMAQKKHRKIDGHRVIGAYVATEVDGEGAPVKGGQKWVTAAVELSGQQFIQELDKNHKPTGDYNPITPDFIQDTALFRTSDLEAAKKRSNTRGRRRNPSKRRNSLPSWRGASAAYAKADKILEVWNRDEAAAQKRAHTKRGRAASTFRYRPTDEIKAFTDALGKGDEEKIKAFNLRYGHMLTAKRRNPRVSFMTKDGPVSFMAKVPTGGKRRNPSKEEQKALQGLKRRLATYDRKVNAIETEDDFWKAHKYLNTIYKWAKTYAVDHLIPEGLGKQAAVAHENAVSRRQAARSEVIRRLRQEANDRARQEWWRRNGGKPSVKAGHKITLHRDGTVSYWNVYERQWRRSQASAVPSRVLESLGRADAARIRRHASQ